VGKLLWAISFENPHSSIGEEPYFAVRTNIHGLMPYISKFVYHLEPRGFCICLVLMVSSCWLKIFVFDPQCQSPDDAIISLQKQRRLARINKMLPS
jgi:hypothetical protein